MSLKDAVVFRARRWRSAPALYAGRRYACPCCGGSFRRLKPKRGRPNATCPRCGSAERNRLLWLFLDRELHIQDERLSVLHFAPEKGVSGRLASLPGLDYLTADLRAEAAMEAMDITAIPRPDDSFDMVICSHVLEHVPDDRRAMSEMLRVLRPGGRAILQHPIDYDREETYEDASIAIPEARERAFLQHDHVRIYGKDHESRLGEAGFLVQHHRYRAQLDPEERRRFALDTGTDAFRADDIYVCAKPRS